MSEAEGNRQRKEEKEERNRWIKKRDVKIKDEDTKLRRQKYIKCNEKGRAEETGEKKKERKEGKTKIIFLISFV